MFQRIDRRTLAQFDWWLFFIAVLIPSCGLVVLYSAGFDSEYRWSLEWLPVTIQSEAFLKQLAFFAAGVGGLLLTLTITPQRWHRYAYFLYGVAITLLLVVHFGGIISHGSRRWLNLGGVRLQPSELVKIGLILALARYISQHPPKGVYTFKTLLMPAVIIGVPALLILKQPDLGTSISVAFIGVSMVLFVGVRFKTLLYLAAALIAAIVPAWNFILKGYQKRRILALLNPEADPLGSGYHIIQSKIAVGSGGLLGKGYLQGSQSQLEFLPEHTTDFVFSVLSEEWGFIGSSFVLILYFLLVYKMLNVAVKNKELFPALVVFGITMMILLHVLVNIGMVIGLLPVVGLPLVLFSYGGSSLITTLGAIGIVLGFGMRRFMFGK